MTLEEIFTLDSLNEAFYECQKASRWKESTQRYRANLLLNNLLLQKQLISGRYRNKPTIDFWLNQRGKIRKIEAPAMRDRIVQKVLCKKILVPYLTKSLIYDNYASLKKRGTSLARKRIVKNLRRFIYQQKSKNKRAVDGYILQIDIQHYFQSIDHQILKKLIHKKIKEPKEILDLLDYIIDTSSKTNKGLNLGSQAPQIFAIFYLSQLDSYIKNVLSIKKYGRYMDDMYIIHQDKKYLYYIYQKIIQKLTELKLKSNQKKTHIIKISHGFTFLQIKYNIAQQKIIRRPTRAKINRERRKIKKFKKLNNDNKLSVLDIYNFYKSWQAGIDKDCKNWNKTKMIMRQLFFTLFSNIPKRKKFDRYLNIFQYQKKYIEESNYYTNINENGDIII